MHDTGGGPGRAFATLIKDARQRLDWSQDDLADASGVSRQTISRYESGAAVNPRPDEVRAVCRALQIDPREVVVALGYVTREELGLPPAEPPLPRQIRSILDVLGAPGVPPGAKESLLSMLMTTVEFWADQLGVKQSAKEPTAADRAAGRRTR